MANRYYLRVVARDIGQLLYTLDSIFISGKGVRPHHLTPTRFMREFGLNWGQLLCIHNERAMTVNGVEG